MSEKRVIEQFPIDVVEQDSKAMYLHTNLATAEVPDVGEIEVQTTIGVSGMTIYIRERDGRPGVEVNLRPLIERLVEIHVGEEGS